MSHEFRVIQGCPCPKLIAPYIAVALNDAHAGVNSIYRGDDARDILNKHGKESQTQLYALYRKGKGNPANPPGFSTHELKSDGAAYPLIQRGHDLAWWMQGFDVNDSDVVRVKAAAAHHGWSLFQPYSSGSEFHHLNFRFAPAPHSLRMRLRIAHLRFGLPRH